MENYYGFILEWNIQSNKMFKFTRKSIAADMAPCIDLGNKLPLWNIFYGKIFNFITTDEEVITGSVIHFDGEEYLPYQVAYQVTEDFLFFASSFRRV